MSRVLVERCRRPGVSSHTFWSLIRMRQLVLRLFFIPSVVECDAGSSNEGQRLPVGRRRSAQGRRALALVVIALMTTSGRALAQGVDVTLFLGRAYPVYDERLHFAPSLPALPRVSVTEQGQLGIVAEGERVFGAALAVDFGVFGIEGRYDATDIGFRINGTRYELMATAPVPVREGSVSIGAGRLDADRLTLLSINARIRTPGTVAFVASGGLSYLNDVTIEGFLPVAVELATVPPVSADARLRLIAVPDAKEHRWGLNGGAGLRIGGRHVALMAEARVFYFREFELRLAVVEGPDLLDAILTGIDIVHFEPVVANAQAGIVFRF